MKTSSHRLTGGRGARWPDSRSRSKNGAALKDLLGPDEMLTRVLNDTGYLSYLNDGTPEGESRIENVLELRGVAESYAGLPLSTFLEEVSLISDVDMRDDGTDAPSLLTLHAAKGLEFPVVFIVGLEENILPHSRSIEPERKIDASPEERQKSPGRAGRGAPPVLRRDHARARIACILIYAIDPIPVRRQPRQSAVTLSVRHPRTRCATGRAPRKRGQFHRDQQDYRAMTTWRSHRQRGRSPPRRTETRRASRRPDALQGRR